MATKEPIHSYSVPLRPTSEAINHPDTSPERATGMTSQDNTALLQRDLRDAKPKYERTDYWQFVKKKKYWPWWALLVVLIVLTILMTLYHKSIVNWLKPVSARIRGKSWGWIVPILVLVVLSFPPLFGHEIVIILCGVVYGLGIGFGVAAAGTFLGEVCTFFAFKTFLYKRALRLEQKNLDYGALARMVREGGFWIIFIIRLSVIPSHFTTAVFATCGLNLWIFLIATFITLPKQMVIVYLGVLIGNDSNDSKGRKIQDIVLAITALITVLCAVYIWWKLKRIRKELVYDAGQGAGAGNFIPERTSSPTLEGRDG